jgi:hypothetical protein
VINNKNYDKFCEVNKSNEERKSLSAFFVNLMKNGIIKMEQILLIIQILGTQVINLVKSEGNKSVVDEIIETIVILYDPDWVDSNPNAHDFLIDGNTVREFINSIIQMKKNPKYPSLSNKTVFKCMDILKM